MRRSGTAQENYALDNAFALIEGQPAQITITSPTKNIMAMAIAWKLVSCSCPSWNLSMDESALRSALASLSDCGSSLHWWLRFWTWWVVIGVALEIVFVVWEYIEERHDRRLCLVQPSVKPNLLLFLLGLLGAGLVAVGVAKELNVESKIGTIETCIRKGNDQLSLLLSKEAGDAAKSASTAQDEADAATEAAGRARSEADLVAAQAQQLAKQVEALSPRTLSVEQQRHMATALRQFGHAHPTVVASYGLDGEGSALGGQLIAIFHTARIPVRDARAGMIVSGGFDWGISIRGPAYEMSYMLALQDVLTTTGNLKQVSINGPSAVAGATMGGTAGMGGMAGMSGGGGPPIQQPLPTAGPVSVFVGIRPPTVIP